MEVLFQRCLHCPLAHSRCWPAIRRPYLHRSRVGQDNNKLEAPVGPCCEYSRGLPPVTPSWTLPWRCGGPGDYSCSSLTHSSAIF